MPTAGYDAQRMFQRKTYRLHLPSSGTLLLGRRTLVMGVVNVTPDSFFAGSSFLDTPSAIAQAIEIASEPAPTWWTSAANPRVPAPTR